MAVQIEYGTEARAKLLAGARKLNDAVSATLGPSGRWVVFRHMGQVVSTKDGVTAAREVVLSDPYEAMGADLIKGAASQAVNEAGDGTTTATLLATAIFEAGCQAVEEGAEPVQLVAGIQAAVTHVVGEYDAKKKKFQGGVLESFAVPITPELAYNAARISANGDEAIAKVVSEAVLQVGVEGALTIGNSFSQEHVLEVAEGMQIDSGYAHPYLMNDPQRNRAVLEDVTLLLINRRINSAAEVVNIMKKAVDVATAHSRAFSLLLVADDFDPEAIAQIVHHKMHDHLRVLAVRAPLWGDARRDLLEDISLLTQARRIENQQGRNYEDLTRKDFGFAQRVVATSGKTVLTAAETSDFARKERIEPYLARLKEIIADETLRPDQVDAAKGRLAALTGGVAVIRVGGTSADAVNQTKFQVEDAIHACRAAVSDGVVPGGGSALLFARACALRPHPSLDRGRGYHLLLDALEHPLRKIALNAGYEPDNIASIVAAGGDESPMLCRNGFDASTGGFVSDMIAAGIVDPLRVVRSSLNAAASAACILLKTQAVIVEEAAKK